MRKHPIYDFRDILMVAEIGLAISVPRYWQLPNLWKRSFSRGSRMIRRRCWWPSRFW